jgi:hypothetical protein
MRLTIALATLAMVLQVSSVPAAISVSVSRSPTPFLPGYVTDILTATAETGEKIIGFDFVGGPTVPYGFLGPMNQLNPAAQPTVFADHNGFIPFISNFDWLQDSQFRVNSTYGIAINPSESANSLKAAFNYNNSHLATDATNVWSFVQIAHAAEVSYSGTLTVRNASGQDRLEVISGALSAVPEPASIQMITFIALGGIIIIHRKRGRKLMSMQMLPNTLAIGLVFYLAATSHAAIIISASFAPTTGLPGYTTATVTATNTNATEKIIGFDFVGDGTKGFFGTMNQVNPAGQPTVFADNNGFFAFVGATPNQDSQFQVVSTTGIAINPSESANKLQAAFNYSAANIPTLASNVWSFVHIAHPDASFIFYSGTLTIRDAQGHDRLVLVENVPEPATLPIVGLCMVGSLAMIRRRSV